MSSPVSPEVPSSPVSEEAVRDIVKLGALGGFITWAIVLFLKFQAYYGGVASEKLDPLTQSHIVRPGMALYYEIDPTSEDQSQPDPKPGSNVIFGKHSVAQRRILPNVHSASECAKQCANTRQYDSTTGTTTAAQNAPFACTAYQYGPLPAQWARGIDSRHLTDNHCMLASVSSYPPKLFSAEFNAKDATAGYVADRFDSKFIFMQFVEQFAWAAVAALLFIAYYAFFVDPEISSAFYIIPVIGALFISLYLVFVGFPNSEVTLEGNNCPSGTECRPDAISQSASKSTCYTKCCGRSKTFYADSRGKSKPITCTWPNFPCIAAGKEIATHVHDQKAAMNVIGRLSVAVPPLTPICAATSEQCAKDSLPPGAPGIYMYSDGKEESNAAEDQCPAQDDAVAFRMPSKEDALNNIISIGEREDGSYQGEFDCGQYYTDSERADHQGVYRNVLNPNYLQNYQCKPPGQTQYFPNVTFTQTAQRRQAFGAVIPPKDPSQWPQEIIDIVNNGNCGMGVLNGQQMLYVQSSKSLTDMCRSDYTLTQVASAESEAQQ